MAVNQYGGRCCYEFEMLVGVFKRRVSLHSVFLSFSLILSHSLSHTLSFPLSGRYRSDVNEVLYFAI